jgi:hypothetical protein
MNAALRLCAGLIFCLCCLGAQEDKKLNEGIWIGVTVENASYSMGRISIADWAALSEGTYARTMLLMRDVCILEEDDKGKQKAVSKGNDIESDVELIRVEKIVVLTLLKGNPLGKSLPAPVSVEPLEKGLPDLGVPKL